MLALLKFMCYKGHFSCQVGTHEVEHKHADEIIEEDEKIHGGNRHCKNCTKKNPILNFTDENSYKRQSCRILKILNKWWSFSD